MKTNLRILPLALAPLLTAPIPVAGGEETEWDPARGFHEEEWYDPSDWLDEHNQVEYERQGYGYYGDDWRGVPWYDTYDYADPLNVDYEWNPETEEWQLNTTAALGTGYTYGHDIYDVGVAVEGARGTEVSGYSGEASPQSRAESPAGDKKPLPSAMEAEVSQLTGRVKDFRKIDLSAESGYAET